MKATRTRGVPKCVLNATEQKWLDLTSGVCNLLAYHYKDTDLGDSMAGIVRGLDALSQDQEICPPAADGEKAKGE